MRIERLKYIRARNKFFARNYRLAPETLEMGLLFNRGVRLIELEFARGWDLARRLDTETNGMATEVLIRKARKRREGSCF